MSQTIEIDIGDLYAEMHEQYSDDLDDQYEPRLRQQVEDFLHQFNQQVERQQEQVGQEEDLELAEAEE